MPSPVHLMRLLAAPSLALPLLLLLAVSVVPPEADAAGRSVEGDPVVLAGETPGRLLFDRIERGSLTLRSTYQRGLPGTTQYTEGQDFSVDYAAGTLRRLPGSRIPDFSKNILFGQKDFNHTRFPGYGNGAYFVYADYTHRGRLRVPPAGAAAGTTRRVEWPPARRQEKLLTRTREKLRRGQPVKLCAFGDSITNGGEATAPGLIYWMRWSDALKHLYPKATMNAINSATGGDTTANGLQRLDDKVLSRKPDLVLVAFGMNDQNVGSIPEEKYRENLRTIVDRIRAGSSAEIVLLSSCMPNPAWHYTSGRMENYARITGEVAAEKGCAFADVLSAWKPAAERKKPEDLLTNNINHPNDFGHWIYFRVLEGLGL